MKTVSLLRSTLVFMCHCIACVVSIRLVGCLTMISQPDCLLLMPRCLCVAPSIRSADTTIAIAICAYWNQIMQCINVPLPANIILNTSIIPHSPIPIHVHRVLSLTLASASSFEKIRCHFARSLAKTVFVHTIACRAYKQTHTHGRKCIVTHPQSNCYYHSFHSASRFWSGKHLNESKDHVSTHITIPIIHSEYLSWRSAFLFWHSSTSTLRVCANTNALWLCLQINT